MKFKSYIAQKSDLVGRVLVNILVMCLEWLFTFTHLKTENNASYLTFKS